MKGHLIANLQNAFVGSDDKLNVQDHQESLTPHLHLKL